MSPYYNPIHYASEAQIQNAILDYLMLRGVLAWRTNSGDLLITNNNGSSRRIKLAPKGTADIIGIMPDGSGRLLAIETKDRKGKQTPEQIEFMNRVRESGGVYILARSTEDVEREIF